MWEKLKEFFNWLFDDVTDPVKHCEVYLDKENGSCTHVDGPLCSFPVHCGVSYIRRISSQDQC